MAHSRADSGAAEFILATELTLAGLAICSRVGLDSGGGRI